MEQPAPPIYTMQRTYVLHWPRPKQAVSRNCFKHMIDCGVKTGAITGKQQGFSIVHMAYVFGELRWQKTRRVIKYVVGNPHGTVVKASTKMKGE